MKIALASATFPKSIEDGLTQVKKLVKDAAQQRSEIICFPESYIPGYPVLEFKPEKSTPEKTVKAVAVGLLLALIFGAANASLGMKAGQTIAATIPAAVIAIALFRLPHFHGTILEQNIARTAA